MIKIGKSFVQSFLLTLFFTGNVLAVESNGYISEEEISKHTSI